jgi:hypothetical protein
VLLRDVLTVADLPVAELAAIRLDGGLFESGDGYAVVDSVDGPTLRADSLAPLLVAPRVADRSTAAWIWGAAPLLPRPLEACVRPGRSQGIEPLRGVQVRESTLEVVDIVRLGVLEVTTPHRTVLDLLRLPQATDTTGAARELMVRRLIADFAIEVDELLGDLADTRFQRERRRAREQLLRL